MRYHKVFTSIGVIGMLLGWAHGVTQTTLQLLHFTRLHGASSIPCCVTAFRSLHRSHDWTKQIRLKNAFKSSTCSPTTGSGYALILCSAL